MPLGNVKLEKIQLSVYSGNGLSNDLRLEYRAKITWTEGDKVRHGTIRLLTAQDILLLDKWNDLQSFPIEFNA